ncbi:MAG: NAD(P)/FAD-dependent oxidoreductase [Sandaracinaceae bacterium]|nr:NAD(P)/FAD-dependent oxidoreductase [Sandaracinaceae bacterium]
MPSSESTDIAVCGGGLAGLTLALQLRRRLPEARVTVLEPTRRPLPEAALKVGESSVEVGAHYFGHVLGLHDHMMARHLRKNGLRFFSGPPRAPLERRAEMGPPEPPNLPAYQIDRGRFENELRAMCVDAGVDLREGVGVRDVALDPEGHTLTIIETRASASASQLRARWVVDATGRRRLLGKKLGLGQPLTPNAHATWFRVPQRIDLAELVGKEQRAWHERDVDRTRWLSTNHFCGRGYWLWLIPLSSEHTSVGIVAEAEEHPYTTISTPEAALAWIAEHEPEVSRRLAGVPMTDFLTMRDYRYHARQVLSADRWACVGEAGFFVDPLYSPGSDVIGMGNTLTTELIVEDLREGRLDAERVRELDAFLLSWARMLARTLAGGSMVFQCPEVLSAKLYWDYYYYWAMMCPYFFEGIYRLPVAEHRRFSDMLMRWRRLNEHAQRVLRAWAEVSTHEPVVEQVGLPQPATTLSDLHLALLERKDPARTYADMEQALAWGEELVGEILLRALRRAGPGRIARLSQEVALDAWQPAVSEARLAADEAPPRERRKLLTRPVRDLERSIGKNAAESEDAPRLRALWALARRAPLDAEPVAPHAR